jgi:hypothetical protein
MLFAIGAALPGTRAGQKADAAVVMAAAREALGGEKRLSSVRSFSVTGRTQQVGAESLVPIEFEIVCELPDRYARKDEFPAQKTTTGFNGTELIQWPVPEVRPARAGARPPGPAQQEAARTLRVTAIKQDFVRLTLGMFATSFPSYPLTFSYAGQAEAPQGKADVIDAHGADNFVVRLFVLSTTRLPAMVSWMPPAQPVRPGAVMTGAARGGGPAVPAPGAKPGVETQPGGPSPRPAGGAATEAGRAPAPTAPPASPGPQPALPGAPSAARAGESRIYYADYRDVDGLRLPFRLRRTAEAETVEETIVDRYRINPTIDPRRFEVRK